jgi:hypothetical protein
MCGPSPATSEIARNFSDSNKDCLAAEANMSGQADFEMLSLDSIDLTQDSPNNDTQAADEFPVQCHTPQAQETSKYDPVRLMRRRSVPGMPFPPPTRFVRRQPGRSSGIL